MGTSPKLIMSLLLILGFMQILDVTTTHIALSLGAIECNMLMKDYVLKPIGILMKMLWYFSFTCTIYMLWYRLNCSTVRRFISYLCVMIVLTYFIVNLNNILVILLLSY